MIESIVEEVIQIVGDGIQWKEDLVSLTGVIMRLIQQKRELKGHGRTKKRVVEIILTKLLDQLFFDESQAETVSKFIVEMLPTTVDMLKSLARSIAEANTLSCSSCVLT